MIPRIIQSASSDLSALDSEPWCRIAVTAADKSSRTLNEKHCSFFLERKLNDRPIQSPSLTTDISIISLFTDETKRRKHDVSGTL